MGKSSGEIRNFVIAGHGGSGKSVLFEHFLAYSGAQDKAAQTVSTTGAALASFEHKGHKINVFDTPGAPDFSGETILSFRGSDFMMLAVDGRAGVQIETVKLFRKLSSKPRGIFITKLDDEKADFHAVLRDIKEKLKIDGVPFTIPAGKTGDFKGVIDVLKEKMFVPEGGGKEKEAAIPSEYRKEAIDARLKLMEIAADGDEVIMEKYILLGALEPDDVLAGLKGAFRQNLYVPVFAISAQTGCGTTSFLDFCGGIAPEGGSAFETVIKEGNTEEITGDDSAPLAAFVLKTVFDQFSGKISWVKVARGVLSADSEIYNLREKKKERISKLFIFAGKKITEVKEVQAGDLCLITKSATLKTNDSFSAGEGSALNFIPLEHPEPVYSVAVQSKEKKDDAKIGDFLNRSAEEDKTFVVRFNSETKETVISGMGEMHINMILDKLKTSQKIEILTSVPRIAYRETIGKKAGAEYTHKKQTGGHGQYGRVVLEIAPLPRGAGYEFINAIFGGAVPKNYIPGVEKGIAEAMQRGVLAGFPVVDVEVKLTDGKYHPVDSSELSFSLASRNAFKLAMKDASPVLLEPIMNLTVYIESKYLGDVLSDLSAKRAKITGQSSLGGGIEEVRAQAPQKELLRYAIDLRSITSGTGSFAVEESHYAPVSGRIAEDIIKNNSLLKTEEEDE